MLLNTKNKSPIGLEKKGCKLQPTGFYGINFTSIPYFFFFLLIIPFLTYISNLSWRKTLIYSFQHTSPPLDGLDPTIVLRKEQSGKYLSLNSLKQYSSILISISPIVLVYYKWYESNQIFACIPNPHNVYEDTNFQPTQHIFSSITLLVPPKLM